MLLTGLLLLPLLPQNVRLKHTLVSGVRAYLQPTDGIQTRRTVSCVRWNPANEEQASQSLC